MLLSRQVKDLSSSAEAEDVFILVWVPGSPPEVVAWINEGDRGVHCSRGHRKDSIVPAQTRGMYSRFGLARSPLCASLRASPGDRTASIENSSAKIQLPSPLPSGPLRSNGFHSSETSERPLAHPITTGT